MFERLRIQNFLPYPHEARAHACLTTKPKKHSAGVAAKQRYSDFDHDALDDVRQFLKSL